MSHNTNKKFRLSEDEIEDMFDMLEEEMDL